MLKPCVSLTREKKPAQLIHLPRATCLIVSKQKAQ